MATETESGNIWRKVSYSSSGKSKPKIQTQERLKRTLIKYAGLVKHLALHLLLT